MTAPKGWRKGSFRGLSFVSKRQERAGGRRGVVHEHPNRDVPTWEDLGRKAGRFTLECEIRGADYIADAERFDGALNAAGAGTLVHPWLGPMRCGVDEFSRTDDTDEGGFAVYSIVFVESGLPVSAQAVADTASLAHADARAAATAAPVALARRLNVSGVQGFVEDHAAQLVAKAATAMAVVSGLQGGIGPALLAIQGNLGVLPPNVAAMLRSPLELGATLVGAAQSIVAVGGSSVSLVGGLIGLLGFGRDLDPITGSTVARDRQRENQAAIVQLVNLACAAALTDAIADISFPSYQDAVAIRDAATAALDDLAVRQADAGDDEGAAQFDQLRRAIARDITQRGGSLARLQDYTPAVTEPAVVIAYRLYGRDGLDARTDQLIARNSVAHPGFVAGGATLQVLTPTERIANG